MNKQANNPAAIAELPAEYEAPQIELHELSEVIRGIGGSNIDGDNTPTNFA